MDSSPSWLPAVADQLGPAEVVGPAGGGVWRISVGGTELAVKTGEGVDAEALGLQRLAGVAGGPRVPAVVYCDPGLLVTEWIASGSRSPADERELGRRLATLHRALWPEWGGGSAWIGACRVSPVVCSSASEFYAQRLKDLAGRCGLSAEVDAVTARFDSLIPPGPPALLHGDLWWGNVLWSPGGPVLIDPSVYGGHPEEDLAMLALFGSVPERLLAAYSEVRPLDAGWRERVQLWQLYPLLVHTVLFGGSYRARAAAVARRYC